MKFFLIDFDKNIYVKNINNLKDIYFSFPSIAKLPPKTPKKNLFLKKYPISFNRYQKAFNEVINEIKKGNTYLLNLTFPTKIETNYSLIDIFNHSIAPFKLYFKDKFVCFSPERFVKIQNNKIYTYPMKGTIDASIQNAKEKILNNQKEMAEHTMVVDLLRNDLGIIGKKIKVNKFRFIDKIKAGDKELLQVSSEIEATIDNWQKNWLEMILQLLPAGSISGTPKKKTIEIIKRVENYNRGFYTGIFGITDEKTFLDSAVIIRYIEKDKNLIYKSGGGITIDSNVKEEYEELIKKVYIPI
jgi:para-aminobenzoate synthetase component 1